MFPIASTMASRFMPGLMSGSHSTSASSWQWAILKMILVLGVLALMGAYLYYLSPLGLIMGFFKSARPSRVADCPPTYTNNGATCGRSLKLKTANFGLGPYESADCPPGYTNTGTTCHDWGGKSFARDYFSRAGKSTSFDMEQCEKKYGKGNCETKGIAGTRHVFPTCEVEAKHLKKEFPERYKSDGGITAGARCHRNPHTLGSIANHGVCPPANDKQKKYTEKRGALCYINCAKTYGHKDWYHNGTNCALDASTKPMSSMSCKKGETKIGARCYKPCPSGKKPDKSGLFCVNK